MRLSVWMCCLCVAGIPAAGFADVFAYEQDNGTMAFTDKLERVPARYKAKVQRRADPKLREYSRTTITAVKPRVRDAKALAAEAALAVEESLAEAQTEERDAKRPLMIEAAPGVSIPVEAEGDEPVRVERRFRWIGGRYTPVTIVRQGDRVLAVIDDDGTSRF